MKILKVVLSIVALGSLSAGVAEARQVSCEARSRATSGSWVGYGYSREEASGSALAQCDTFGPRRHCYIASCRGDEVGEPGRRYTCTYYSSATGQSYQGTSNDQGEAQQIAASECDRFGPRKHCRFQGCISSGRHW